MHGGDLVRLRLFGILGVALAFSASVGAAQAPRFEMGAGLAAGGPTRTTAEYAVLGVGARLASYRALTVGLDASVMLRISGDVRITCPNVPGVLCDTREFGHVARAGVTARYGARDGTGGYVLASAGGWASQWDEERFAAAVTSISSMSRPYGGVAELGVGTSLPIGDRRNGIELRLAHFQASDVSVGGLTIGTANAARLTITRRW